MTEKEITDLIKKVTESPYISVSQTVQQLVNAVLHLRERNELLMNALRDQINRDNTYYTPNTIYVSSDTNPRPRPEPQ